MRPILFLVADNECSATIRGALDDPKRRHWKLGCGEFPFDPAVDILVHPNKDAGVYAQAADLLRLQMQKQPYERVVIILDEAWKSDKNPGKTKIEANIHTDVVKALRCNPADVVVICIQPELEAWIWQDNPVVEAAFQFKNGNLRQWLAGTADVRGKIVVKPDPLKKLLPLWPVGQLKPTDPKRAVEVTRAISCRQPPSAIFNEITRRASFARCTDPAFIKLRKALQGWFGPPPAQAQPVNKNP